MEKYKITVSEPWDFEGPAGKNLIVGSVIKSVSDEILVFKSDHVLHFNELTGNILILQSRYEKHPLKNKSGYNGTAGGSLFLLDWNSNQQSSKDFLEKNSKYVIIGSLEKDT
ncbi:MAG: hypothetical protein ACXVP0_07440 [Bacteroidia bacterium]